jgi:predicted methyltransferase
MIGQAQLRRPRCLMAGRLTIAALLSACLAMTAASAQDRAPDYVAIVAAPDRTEADVQTDKRRDPIKLLAFTGAHPGMKVLDMGAGGGYSTELMARAVAPSGVVYGQNPADIGERAKTRFEARLLAYRTRSVDGSRARTPPRQPRTGRRRRTRDFDAALAF